MSDSPYSRRRFLRDSALVSLAMPLLPRTSRAATSKHNQGQAGATTEAAVHWLESPAPASFAGVTWGTAWPRGAVSADKAFELREASGNRPLQSWPLAWWPDGSVKWSAHALGGDVPGGHSLSVVPVVAYPPSPEIASETPDGWRINTGPIQALISRNGEQLIEEIRRGDQTVLTNGRLVLRTCSGDEDQLAANTAQLAGKADSVVLEQNGPQRAVITLRGTHRNAEDAVIRFVVRLYWYAGAASVRVIHTLIYDNEQPQRAVSGIGLAFDAPQTAELYDRHVRFVSDQGGIFHESVRGLSGLRRSPGQAVIEAQLRGTAAPPLSEFTPIVAERLALIPAFGNYRLMQHHPDGYLIRKRTAPHQSWLSSATGSRAAGVGYLGSPQGGIAFGIRNFWQSYPACLDIAGADSDLATVTLWLWSPWAEAMDMGSWHDEMSMTTYQAQRNALDITYEDYEPGYDSPVGVARTSELFIDLLPHTPDDQQLLAITRRMQHPPQLVTRSETLSRAGVFGPVWAPASRFGKRQQPLREQLAWYFDFYRREVEQRKWYGFWDYGDVMHTYDSDRHVWRYDIGGFAWDNSELSTDLWLWYYYLHSGRADVFRMAEAMTRHTGEVDVYHLGRFAPLGSRHNVLHWGDSAKQLRISTVANRRFLYYLTADERIGDLMDEQIEGVRTLQKVPPGRKIGQKPASDPHYVSLYFGTDWSAVAAAWLTAWERRNDNAMRQRLLNSMQSIAAQPHGFFTGLSEMNADTGIFRRASSDQLFISHLSAVFGLAEICSELLQLLPDESFTRAWLDYCRLYNDLPALSKFVGKPVKKLNLVQGHARLTAFAAWHQHDKSLVKRSWQEFYSGQGGIVHPNQQQRLIRPPEVLYPVREAEIDSSIDKRSGSTGATDLATNAVSQWGLTALSLLALLDSASDK